MIRIRAEEASYEVAPGTAQEHALLEARSWAQARADQLNPPEWMMWQEEQYVAVHVKGNLNLYGNEEAVLRSEAIPDWSFSLDETRLRVLDQAPSDPYAVKIEFGGSEFWIDLRDLGAELEFRRVDLASSPFTSRRAQVSGQIYDNTSLDFLNTLNSARPPALPSFVVEDDAYHGGTLDIELSDFEWANRSGVGLLSRDLNPLGSTASFQVQSPVVGPDVRVEIVSWEDKHDRNLGNYVVVSFPASVFLQNPQLMESLAQSPNHNPSDWREDGRIFIGLGHLSTIDTQHIFPEAILQDAGQATIGWTGNTAFHLDLVNHLDVSMAYFGPTRFNRDGFADAMEHMSKDRTEPNSYMTLAIRSNLFQGEGKGSVYGENIDIVRIWPHFDRLKLARTTRDEDGNNDSIYQQE
ncbi:MAG: hypothetical protein OXG60_08095 [Chloroflexi bacterium]|nr:hypothetical protein [Chloroflexota bacterium]